MKNNLLQKYKKFFFLNLILKKRNELDDKIVEIISNFVFELLIGDELQMARLLRKKLLCKVDVKKQQFMTNTQTVTDTISLKSTAKTTDGPTYSAYSLANSLTNSLTRFLTIIIIFGEEF